MEPILNVLELPGEGFERYGEETDIETLLNAISYRPFRVNEYYPPIDGVYQYLNRQVNIDDDIVPGQYLAISRVSFSSMLGHLITGTVTENFLYDLYSYFVGLLAGVFSITADGFIMKNIEITPNTFNRREMNIINMFKKAVGVALKPELRRYVGYTWYQQHCIERVFNGNALNIKNDRPIRIGDLLEQHPNIGIMTNSIFNCNWWRLLTRSFGRNQVALSLRYFLAVHSFRFGSQSIHSLISDEPRNNEDVVSNTPIDRVVPVYNGIIEHDQKHYLGAHTNEIARCVLLGLLAEWVD